MPPISIVNQHHPLPGHKADHGMDANKLPQSNRQARKSPIGFHIEAKIGPLPTVTALSCSNMKDLLWFEEEGNQKTRNKLISFVASGIQ
eukprot:14103998-Ditylum_brightwellii.AAC.1